MMFDLELHETWTLVPRANSSTAVSVLWIVSVFPLTVNVVWGSPEALADQT